MLVYVPVTFLYDCTSDFWHTNIFILFQVSVDWQIWKEETIMELLPPGLQQSGAVLVPISCGKHSKSSCLRESDRSALSTFREGSEKIIYYDVPEKAALLVLMWKLTHCLAVLSHFLASSFWILQVEMGYSLKLDTIELAFIVQELTKCLDNCHSAVIFVQR